PPSAHHFMNRDSVPKSRRKPRHTNRILPQHFSHMDDHDEEDGMQTQPLNLSISPALTVSKQLSTHLGLNSINARQLYNSSPGTTDDDVLDLSRSRSDAESEPEPIEEDEDDEDESEVTVKEEEMDEVVMMHQNSGYLDNGQDSFKRHHIGFGKHYS